MILFAERGKVKVSLSVFSLKYLVKSCRIMIPAVCIDREGEVLISDSEIKGNETKETIGVLSRLGVLEIRNSVVSGHKAGGIIVWGNRENGTKIIKNKI